MSSISREMEKTEPRSALCAARQSLRRGVRGSAGAVMGAGASLL